MRLIPPNSSLFPDVEASGKIQEMGVLPLMPTLLATQNSSTPKVANVIAEVAKNGEDF